MLLVSKKSAPLFANKGRRYRDAEGGTISSFLRLGELILHGENGGKSEDTHSLSDLDFDAQAQVVFKDMLDMRVTFRLRHDSCGKPEVRKPLLMYCSGIFVLDSSKNNSLRGLDRYDQ